MDKDFDGRMLTQEKYYAGFVLTTSNTDETDRINKRAVCISRFVRNIHKNSLE